jgi:hypothetical protein
MAERVDDVTKQERMECADEVLGPDTDASFAGGTSHLIDGDVRVRRRRNAAA